MPALPGQVQAPRQPGQAPQAQAPRTGQHRQQRPAGGPTSRGSKPDGGTAPGKPGQHSRPGSRQPAALQPAGGNRLSKVLAGAGVASRRAAEQLIFQGCVTVNGQRVLLPQTPVDLGTDQISVNGQKVAQPSERFVFALNKPKGYLCSSTRPAEGETAPSRLVIDIFQDWIQHRWKPNHLSKHALPPRLFTVGRLDAQTTGLIFVTNDGQWAQRVQHPSSGLTKEYMVSTAARLTQQQMKLVAAGCDMDGVHVAPVAVELVPGMTDRLRVIVAEGRNREIRRLLEHAGAEVQNLKRVRIGSYELDRQLGVGKFRQLKHQQAEAVLQESLAVAAV